MNGRRQFFIYFVSPMILLAIGIAFAWRVDGSVREAQRVDIADRAVAVQKLMDKSRSLEMKMMAIKAELDTIKTEVRMLQEDFE